MSDAPTPPSEEMPVDAVLGDDPEILQLMSDHMPSVALHRLLGLKFVKLDRTETVVEMPVKEEAFNSTGNLHGGAIATLIDVAAGTAAAVGSRFRPGMETIVTADLHVRYLGRPKGDVVRAHAVVLRAGRQLIVVECRVVDDFDNVIAVCDFSSMLVPLREPLRPVATADRRQPDM